MHDEKSDKKLCVIIPVHKPVPTNEEIISLQACYKHLKQHDCFLVFPDAMPVTAYLKIHAQLILRSVPATWLASIENYNRMKTSLEFYALFKNYDFLMTFEPDAYIFSSAIEKYFGYDFDFIGAPVFSVYEHAASFIPGLNSGFSIRNIRSCTMALKALEKFRCKWKWYRFLLWNIPAAKKLMDANKRFIIKDGYLKAFYRGGYFHEDYIFTRIVPLIFPAFKIALPEKALQFSFESNPALLFKMNNEQLPLGCHAWLKHIEFWKNYIVFNNS